MSDDARGGPMVAGPADEDWAALGIPPTDDAAAVKRAYRVRLREAGPDRDPEAFQRLRAAYEAVLAHLERPAADATPEREGRDGHAAAAEAFVMRLLAHRTAGDEAGAIAALDEEIARHPPGSAALAALEDELFVSTALSRNLSPGLFRHMVRRFDWSDANGRAARSDPERHALVADRLAAEEWVERLRTAEGPLERALASPDPAALRAQMPPGPLTREAKDVVRELFRELDAHAMFVLHRFDARVLAALREAVEGPPLIAAPAPAAPAATPATTPWAAGTPAPPPGMPADPTKPKGFTLRTGIAIAVVAGVVGGLGAAFRSERPPSGSSGTPATLSAASPLRPEEARRRLADPAQPWITLNVEPGGVLVDFAPITALRRGVADLRIGSNREEPDTPMPLPANGAVARWTAPEGLRFLTLRARMEDGTWLPVRRYDIPAIPRATPASPAKSPS